MDSFLNLAKQGYEAYSESQGNVSKTGGEEYNAPSHSNQGDYQQGGRQGYRPNINREEAVNQASQGSDEDSGIFHKALSYVHENPREHGQEVTEEDENHMTHSHQQAYHPDGNPRSEHTSSMSASQMGSAAAMQALKKFTSGGGGGGGGGGQTQLISMAMSEASKLFDSSNGGGGGDKQAVVSGAAMTVMKLMTQQGGGGGGMLGMAEGMIGGGNSGGLGPLKMMSLASKFM